MPRPHAELSSEDDAVLAGASVGVELESAFSWNNEPSVVMLGADVLVFVTSDVAVAVSVSVSLSSSSSGFASLPKTLTIHSFISLLSVYEPVEPVGVRLMM